MRTGGWEEKRKEEQILQSGIKRVKVNKPRTFLPLLVEDMVTHLQTQGGVQNTRIY